MNRLYVEAVLIEIIAFSLSFCWPLIIILQTPGQGYPRPELSEDELSSVSAPRRDVLQSELAGIESPEKTIEIKLWM